MNRVVREHYPVSRLPEDLRAGLVEDRPVSIVIVQDDATSLASARGSNEPGPAPIQGGDFTRFAPLRRAHFPSSADVDAYLDALRNEWTHRER